MKKLRLMMVTALVVLMVRLRYDTYGAPYRQDTESG